MVTPVVPPEPISPEPISPEGPQRRGASYVVGVGVAALIGTVAAIFAGAIHPSDGLALIAVAAIVVAVAELRALFPRQFGTVIQPVAGALRPRKPGLPLVVSAATLVVAVVNAVSALTPNIAWRGRVLLQVEPISGVPIFHQVALPLSVGLGLAAVYLYRRRRRALFLPSFCCSGWRC